MLEDFPRPKHLAPLTPLSFLARSARVYGDRLGVIDGDLRLSYGQLYERSARLAGAVREKGIEPGDRVAFLVLIHTLCLRVTSVSQRPGLCLSP